MGSVFCRTLLPSSFTDPFEVSSHLCTNSLRKVLSLPTTLLEGCRVCSWGQRNLRLSKEFGRCYILCKHGGDRSVIDVVSFRQLIDWRGLPQLIFPVRCPRKKRTTPSTNHFLRRFEWRANGCKHRIGTTWCLTKEHQVHVLPISSPNHRPASLADKPYAVCLRFHQKSGYAHNRGASRSIRRGIPKRQALVVWWEHRSKLCTEITRGVALSIEINHRHKLIEHNIQNGILGGYQ